LLTSVRVIVVRLISEEFPERELKTPIKISRTTMPAPTQTHGLYNHSLDTAGAVVDVVCVSVVCVWLALSWAKACKPEKIVRQNRKNKFLALQIVFFIV
jgi:hypothetical protein